jgi:hypothetical protein
MVPSILHGMDAFPLTASGKIDRRRLLDERARRVETAVPGSAMSSLEACVADAWRRVLPAGPIGADSNFFEIGGTSLSVFTVVHELRSALGLARDQLSDASVYEHATVRELAARIDNILRGEPTLPARARAAVTLRKGRADLAPLFVIASSGGTLGAYDKLSKGLKTDREIVGIRDPFVQGGREPTMGFQSWVATYVAAIRERQPRGPYFVCAFSSAGAFGYEIAQHLRTSGEAVAQLILIDPIGIAGEVEEDFGFQVFRALFRGRRDRLRVRLGGWWRHLSAAGRRDSDQAGANDFSLTAHDLERRIQAVRRDKKVIKELSSLFELNTGLPFTLNDADFVDLEPDQYVAALLSRVKALTPEVDPDTVERILVQYYCLQLPATHFYRLKRYDGRVEIFEPAGPYVGLLAAYFRAYVDDLRVHTLAVGAPSQSVRAACENLSKSLRTHYRSMRDETFVALLAEQMEPLLR